VSKRFFVRKSAAILGLIGALSMSLFNSCTKDNPVAFDKEVPSYTFSGSVLDGYTGKALGGAIVTYYDDKGDTVTTKTNANGGFSISKIPYGDRSFFFSYRSTGTDTPYTTAAVTLAGQDWENLGDNVDSLYVIIRNIAGAVKLYPLAGSISGNVLSQVNDRSELNAVAGTVVKVTFTPKDNNQKDSTSVNGSNVEVGPRTFEAKTDASGSFSIAGLPVSGNADDKVTIKVVSVTDKGVDWAMVGDGIAVELVKGQSVPVGQIVLKPIVIDPLVALANNFKTGVVTPEHTFEISYSAALDSVASYAVLFSKDDGRNVVIATTISGKKVTINPAYSLVNENSYQIKIFAYGLKGSSAIDSFDVTAAGGGLADVVSSNILTDTKSPVYNFPKKTAITFTFTDSIVGQPSVKVDNNDISFNPSNKTLTITPKSIWKDGTVYVTVVLASGKTVSFSTALVTENALSYVTSNVYDFNTNSVKNGLGLQDPIVFTTNKAIENTAKVILTQGGVSLPTTVTVAEGGQQISIQPVNSLKAATSYTVTITVETASGESKSSSSTFTTTAAKFYPIFDNVRIGNDATMPRLDFAPNANIIIQMNDAVKKATASLSGGVNVKVTIQGDSIIIDPEVILTEGTAYNLSVTAEDSLGNTMSGAYVTGLVPRALVIILASNIITADNAAIVNAARNITPWFKLSSAPDSASIKAIIATPSIDAKVTVVGDTLFVDPVADFAYEATPMVTITGVAKDGNYISFNKSFTVMKKPVISIVKSNVLNDNYEGAINVAEDIEMWYKLSRAPVASSVTAKTDGNNAVVRVNADTVFVKATYVFNADVNVNVEIHGVDAEGLKFDLLGNGTNWPAFRTRPALFPVASNTWGVKGKGDPVKNFAFYDTMWVKFSQNLSTNLNDITWQNSLNIDGTAGNDVDVFVTADPKSNPNATAWIKGDTLFVLPDNRAAITWNEQVGFGVTVKTALGQSSTINAFEVETSPLNLFVKATNTLRADGTARNDVGFNETLFVVSSVKIDSIKDVTVGNLSVADGYVAPPDVAAGLIKTTFKISASKDTIFYMPKIQFVPGSKYSIDFDLYLTDDKNNLRQNKLEIKWQAKEGIAIQAANVLSNPTTYRSFAITGDSLVVTFTKAINYQSTQYPFTVVGFVQATKTWSADAKTVTIKPVNELTAETWANVQNYYTVEYAKANSKGYEVKFQGVAVDGEEFTTTPLEGENRFIPAVRVIPEMGLTLLSTNLLDSTNNVTFALPVTAGQDIRDGVGTDSLLPIASNITLTFSRAIDTVAVKKNPNAYLKLWELLVGTDVQNEITVSYSNAGKTITIDPVVDLKNSAFYYLQIDTLPALIAGAKNVRFDEGVAAAGNYDNKHLFNTAFKTVAKTTANISALVVTDLGVDTVPTTTGDKRYGYSAAGAYTGGAYKGPTALTVRFTELAWNANHDDSVAEYQVQVKTAGSKTTGWYTCSGTLTTAGFSSFDATLKNRNGLTIDLTTQSFYNDLKTDEKKPNADYLNGDAVFNYGDSIAVRIRPIIDDGKDVGEFGQWSNVIYFKDNVAPCDTTMCGAGNYTSAAAGGVTIRTAGAGFGGIICGIRDGISTGGVARPPVGAGNFSGYSDNSYAIMELTFPEDMDLSIAPALTLYYGGGVSATPLSVNSTYSKWVSSRVYRLVVTIPFADYSANDVYCVLSVAGMKDGSGVTVQTHGNIGPTAGVNRAGNGVLSTAVTGAIGTVNLLLSGGLTVGKLW
jgi:hypothetical protein